ncbi:unnamed protein product [Cuscuta campestris]|uniref:Uncharacterized protein n=1 Tax=Cuscuta campestris TaxID=132261 RepID=A0A484LI54_9ASTE|nr:unnamed protein product [Cuscuta campestris]
MYRSNLTAYPDFQSFTAKACFTLYYLLHSIIEDYGHIYIGKENLNNVSHSALLSLYLPTPPLWTQENLKLLPPAQTPQCRSHKYPSRLPQLDRRGGARGRRAANSTSAEFSLVPSLTYTYMDAEMPNISRPFLRYTVIVLVMVAVVLVVVAAVCLLRCLYRCFRRCCLRETAEE